MEHIKTIVLVIIMLIVFLTPTSLAMAKSVYAITEHHEQVIKSYKIEGDQITYQTKVKNLPYLQSGPVAITCDPCSLYLFVTSENTNQIVLINAKTMLAEEDTVTAPGADNLNLACIVVNGKNVITWRIIEEF